MAQVEQTIDLDQPGIGPPALAITSGQFDTLRSFARQHAGIALADHKKSMVQRRVTRRITRLGFDGFQSYCEFLKSDAGRAEHQHLINVLTTNKTEFFRESHHFDHLAKSVLPRFGAQLRANAKNRLRIWSAGCSTGQEAYSIAMTMLAASKDIAERDAKVLATDIDTEILARAECGVYAQADLEGVSGDKRTSFFRTAGRGEYQVSPELKKLISFRHLNLHAEWPMRGYFDAIFCRNVVIYFDKPTQARLFDRFADILAPSGVLYVGHSESLFRVSDRFMFEGQSVYRKIA